MSLCRFRWLSFVFPRCSLGCLQVSGSVSLWAALVHKRSRDQYSRHTRVLAVILTCTRSPNHPGCGRPGELKGQTPPGHKPHLQCIVRLSMGTPMMMCQSISNISRGRQSVVARFWRINGSQNPLFFVFSGIQLVHAFIEFIEFSQSTA